MEENVNRYELIAPCHFGLEAVLKREIQDLGYEVLQTEDGRVTFEGDAEAICRANLFLRTAERILLKVGSFPAYTFDELFEGTKALPWEEFIPADGRVWVTKASSVKRAGGWCKPDGFLFESSSRNRADETCSSPRRMTP